MSHTSWDKHLKDIDEENQAFKTTVLAEARKAVRAAYDAMHNDEIIDIAVSYDGTWHTRGHRSLYGIGVVVQITTGLVVDYEILSKYCHMCSIQKAELLSSAIYSKKTERAAATRSKKSKKDAEMYQAGQF